MCMFKTMRHGLHGLHDMQVPQNLHPAVVAAAPAARGASRPRVCAPRVMAAYQRVVADVLCKGGGAAAGGGNAGTLDGVAAAGRVSLPGQGFLGSAMRYACFGEAAAGRVCLAGQGLGLFQGSAMLALVCGASACYAGFQGDTRRPLRTHALNLTGCIQDCGLRSTEALHPRRTVTALQVAGCH